MKLERQIWDKIEKMQDQNRSKSDKSIFKKEYEEKEGNKAKNESEEDKKITNRKSVYKFIVFRLKNNKVLWKMPIIQTKFFEKLDFLKQLINDFSSTFEWVI